MPRRGTAWGCVGRSVGQCRGAACGFAGGAARGRAGAQHVAVHGRNVEPGWGAAWERARGKRRASKPCRVRRRWGAARDCVAAQQLGKGRRMGWSRGKAQGYARAHRVAAHGSSVVPRRSAAWDRAGTQCDAVQGCGMRPQRSEARGSARALRRRKGRRVWGARGVELCRTQRGAVHGRSVGLRKGRNVGPRRGAACSRAGV